MGSGFTGSRFSEAIGMAGLVPLLQRGAKVARTPELKKKAILFRGAGLGVVWPQFLALAAIGAAFFSVSLNRFRKAISQMA
jgi:ABC-2 type transport system permease protein